MHLRKYTHYWQRLFRKFNFLADLDLEQCVRMKLRHDFAGYYNRPDIFRLKINRQVPLIFSATEDITVDSEQPPLHETSQCEINSVS